MSASRRREKGSAGTRRARGRTGNPTTRRPTRLAAMPGARALALALALGLATAGLASCGGGSSDKLLPGPTAAEIVQVLDQVEQRANEGSCETATLTADQVIQLIEGLPKSVDPELREKLQQGAARLKGMTEDSTECRATPKTESPPPPPPTTTTFTTPAQTQTQTQTQTTPTTDTTTTPPGDGTGDGDGGGAGPGD